jgi:hypothetical protein
MAREQQRFNPDLVILADVNAMPPYQQASAGTD